MNNIIVISSRECLQYDWGGYLKGPLLCLSLYNGAADIHELLPKLKNTWKLDLLLLKRVWRYGKKRHEHGGVKRKLEVSVCKMFFLIYKDIEMGMFMSISYFCLLRRLRSNDIPETRSHVAPRPWFLNIILYQKGSGLLG